MNLFLEIVLSASLDERELSSSLDDEIVLSASLDDEIEMSQRGTIE